MSAEPGAGPEERAERAERALEEAMADRARTWAELQRREAALRDAERMRRRLAEIESSAWWRAGLPLRLLQKALRDPPRALYALATRLERLLKR
ncbi:MAG: hypothetical protein ABR581_05130 [Thermoleophilaceae bacterium]